MSRSSQSEALPLRSGIRSKSMSHPSRSRVVLLRPSRCSRFADHGLSCACLLCRVLIGLEQLLEERAVMDERLTLILRADIALPLRQIDAVCGPVALDDRRVIDRDVG